jgi:tetratricopeptide (TPR) repeat protein
MDRSRSVRIFLSSTFRDFAEERDLLVRRVFPELRARLKDRFVELVDVDLRWGITAEQAERGEVLPICLTEIDRARPFFIGMLGERYGWVPPPGSYAPDLLERQPWLTQHQGGSSVTELEILHGAINQPGMRGRVTFYFRSPAYAKLKGGDYLPAGAQDRQRQRDLKQRIRASGLPVTAYRDPQDFAQRLTRNLWAVLDREFPASSVPDAFEREHLRHEAYAAPRQRLYLGGEDHLATLKRLLQLGHPQILIEGASGGGKSALIANAMHAHSQAHPRDLVHTHYLGASAEAADPYTLVRRLFEFIRRTTGSPDVIADDPQRLMDSLPAWLATASAWAREHQVRWVFAFDAFNSLSDLQDLRWWPSFIPPGVHLVVSCLPGRVHEALCLPSAIDSTWQRLEVRPLTASQRRDLLVRYLARFNKTLPDPLLESTLAHSLAGNPLFLRTLAEELRLFGVHEQLARGVAHYLASQTLHDLFERVLQRVESDCGRQAVKTALVALWASRAGLREKEILDLAQLQPAQWAAIRNALDEALLETGGRLIFAHDYMRQAVMQRYLAQAPRQRQAHRAVARWFSSQPADARRAEEEPYQWRQAGEWTRLHSCLTDRAVFLAFRQAWPWHTLLAYWLDLAQHRGLQVEDGYRRAWARWSRGQEMPQRLAAGAALQTFLSAAGCWGPFAAKLARQCVTWLEAMEGADGNTARKARLEYADLLIERGDHAQAERLLRRLVHDLETHPPLQRSNLVADTHHGLADLHFRRQELDQALPQYQEALRIQEAQYGPHSIEVARCLSGIGLSLHDLGQLPQAREPLERALVIARRVYGQQHRDTATATNNLGRLLSDMGDIAPARDLFKQSMQTFEDQFGPEHPNVALPLGNLASLELEQKNLDIARPLYVRNIRLIEQHLGSQHPSLANPLINLAEVLRLSDEPAAAVDLLRRASAILEIVHGAVHPRNAQCLYLLAHILKGSQRYEEALEVMAQELTIVEHTEGPESDSFAISLQQRGDLLAKLERPDEAAPPLQRALAIVVQKYAADSAQVAAVSASLATVRLMQDQWQAAEPLLLAAISRPGMRQVLVALYEKTGQADKAAAYRAEPTRGPTDGA